MTTSRTNEAKVTGPANAITLGDLRWLVDQLRDGDDSLSIRVMLDQGHQLDAGSTTLSAQVPGRKLAKQPHYRVMKDIPQA